MKKLHVFTLSLVMIASTAFAGSGKAKQKGSSDSKMMFNVAVGAGIPLGNFGKKDTLASSDTTHMTGWAKPGFHFHLGFGYKFTDNVGAMVQIGGNMNGFDAAAYKAKVDPNNTSGYTVSGTSYYVGQYLVGPFFHFPAGDKIGINLRALFGLMTMKYSELTQSFTFMNQTSTDTYKIASACSFGYNIGPGLDYN